MTSDSNGEHFHPGQPDRSSPTRRVAAYHSDIELVGRSQAFIEVMNEVDRVANTNLPILLTGESGIGKEVVASAIHQRSDRRDNRFVAVNCGALQMPESELFGDHENSGLFAQADGGTIFLDDITETSSSFQVQLLHALQTGEIRLSGSNELQKVNVRVITGSDRNIEQEAAAGRFRNDLFQRLNAVSITLPQCIRDYATQQTNGARPAVSNPSDDDWVTLSVIEGRYVAQVLEHTGGNKQAAARVLAIDRKTLDRMIKRHHIDCQHVRRSRAKVSGNQ